jgi:hypothetical protein
MSFGDQDCKQSLIKPASAPQSSYGANLQERLTIYWDAASIDWFPCGAWKPGSVREWRTVKHYSISICQQAVKRGQVCF